VKKKVYLNVIMALKSVCIINAKVKTILKNVTNQLIVLKAYIVINNLIHVNMSKIMESNII
jgi:hypothetical protein